MIQIRQIKETDVENYQKTWLQVITESPYMMREPDEAIHDISALTKRVHSFLNSENSNIFVAYNNEQLIGFVTAWGGIFKRNKHSAYIVIGIVKEFTGQGIGKKLLSELENWAIQNHITRLELTVMTTNTPATSLYKSCGYEIEGIKQKSLIVNGEYIDEYYMLSLIHI